MYVACHANLNAGSIVGHPDTADDPGHVELGHCTPLLL
jgi:hypothetical protein